jgi:amino acid adenylation domain-containing protein
MHHRASVSALFEQQVQRTPDAVALRHGGVQLTYRALNARANQLGRYFRRRGVVPETRVVVCAERCLETVAVLLGIAKAGGAYVPVEPTFPAARIADILASAHAALLVTQGRQPGFEGFDGEILVPGERAGEIAREDTADFDAGSDPENLFAVLFTSGTTGAPKGILIRTSAVASLLTGMGSRFPFQHGDTFLLHRSFTIVGSIWEYFGPLLHGARSTILSGDDARDPATIWSQLIEQRVTHIVVSPTLADAITRHGERHGLESNGLRLAVIGGEPVSRRTTVGWRRRFPGAKVLICYGITETMYIAFFDTSLLEPHGERVPVGAPFQTGTVRIVNETMECVEDGGVGEICVSSPRLARGYLNAPRLTAERFVPNPWPSRPGEILYRTGDLGCWRPDGALDVIGRRDRQVKVKGFRVELDEVEALVRRVAHAANVAVVAFRDSNQRPKLIAYIETDASIAAEDLRRELRRMIPEYMVPSLFVPVPSIPLTAGGKIDRQALTEPPPVAAGAPASI